MLDVDDLPSRTYRSTAQAGGKAIRRLLDLRVVWQRRQRTFPERFDVLAVCSEDDRRYLGRQDRIHVIPNCAPLLPERPRVSSGLPRIGFIENCTYMPNEEGVK